MERALLDRLGDPGNATDPADYVRRALQLYYNNETELLVDAGLEKVSPLDIPAARAASGRERQEAARSFLNGAASKVFEDELKESSGEKDLIDFGEDEPDGVSFSLCREVFLDAEWLVLSNHVKESIRLEAFDVQVSEGHIHTVCYRGSYHQRLAPILLIHGIGGVIPSFYKNYIYLARDRPVYGIDLPGFGLSSRIDFPDDWQECELIFVKMIEQWRQRMCIESMVLIGHSFGGYIGARYAMKLSERVDHLCLIEPWGMYPHEEDTMKSRYWIIEEIFGVFRVNAVELFRKIANETIGKVLLKGILSKRDRDYYGRDCLNYFVRMITNGRQSGFKAFSVISNFTFKYSTIPLADQLQALATPLTILCGQLSDLYRTGRRSLSRLKHVNPEITIELFPGAGHHVHVQKPFEVMWFIFKSVLKTEEEVELDRQYFINEMDWLGHLRAPKLLISNNNHTEYVVSDSQNAVFVNLILVAPFLAVIIYLIFYSLDFLLQQFLNL